MQLRPLGFSIAALSLLCAGAAAARTAATSLDPAGTLQRGRPSASLGMAGVVDPGLIVATDSPLAHAGYVAALARADAVDRDNTITLAGGNPDLGFATLSPNLSMERRESRHAPGLALAAGATTLPQATCIGGPTCDASVSCTRPGLCTALFATCITQATCMGAATCGTPSCMGYTCVGTNTCSGPTCIGAGNTCRVMATCYLATCPPNTTCAARAPAGPHAPARRPAPSRRASLVRASGCRPVSAQ